MSNSDSITLIIGCDECGTYASGEVPVSCEKDEDDILYAVTELNKDEECPFCGSDVVVKTATQLDE